MNTDPIILSAVLSQFINNVAIAYTVFRFSEGILSKWVRVHILRLFLNRTLQISLSLPPGVLKTEIQLVTFESSDPNSALRFLCHDGDPNKPRLVDLSYLFALTKAEDHNPPLYVK